ncbi:MAG: hypothetical protein Q8K65_10875 [Alphaproteobacteria bacterium]|nr:hypothetical protein [Alphaproteobacteria bacterium]
MKPSKFSPSLKDKEKTKKTEKRESIESWESEGGQVQSKTPAPKSGYWRFLDLPLQLFNSIFDFVAKAAVALTHIDGKHNDDNKKK